MIRAFQEGYNAKRALKYLINNPYLTGTLEYYDWNNGYAQAQSDMLDEILAKAQKNAVRRINLFIGNKDDR